MIATLINLTIRILLALATLAIQVAFALAAALGKFIALAIAAAWRAWRRRSREMRVHEPPALDLAETRLPDRPTPTVSVFTPRRLKPRPRR